MRSSDIIGRKYATIRSLRSGDIVQVDGGFNCMPAWSLKRVFKDRKGLYIKCRHARHYLDGQRDYEVYVGLYKVRVPSS